MSDLIQINVPVLITEIIRFH